LYWVWKHYRVKADWKSSIKIFGAASTAAIITFLVVNFATLADWMELALGGLTYLFTYLIIAPVIGAVTQIDINNLKVMFSGLGIVSKALNVPLNAMEKMLKAI